MSARVATAALNLRRGPSTDYPIITALTQDTALTVTGQNAAGTWLRVETANGVEGWVSRAYTDFAGRVAIVAAPALPTPVAVVVPVLSGGAATRDLPWTGEYFGNTDLSGTPVLVRGAESINYRWGFGSPSLQVPINNFSARWSRSVSFPAGAYTFNVRSDDGARVYLDDELIIDSWTEQATGFASATREVTAGAHTLVVEYYEARGTASIQFYWERASEAGDSAAPTITEWRGEYFSQRNAERPADARAQRDGHQL